MITNTNTANKTEIDAGYETSKFALGVGFSMAALIGIWGMASLVNALAGNGLVSLIKSYVTAVVGM